jgi:hypothetical protein
MYHIPQSKSVQLENNGTKQGSNIRRTKDDIWHILGYLAKEHSWNELTSCWKAQNYVNIK